MRRQFPLIFKLKQRFLNSATAMAAPYTFWMALFIIVPLFMVFYYGLTDESGGFTAENVLSIATPIHLRSLYLAVVLSIISTLLCFFIAYPLALILSAIQRNSGAAGQTFLTTLFILPMWMNFLLRTTAWMTLLEGNGIVNQILSFLHLPKQHLINTPGAIVLGMVYNFLPFMVLPLFNAVSKIDPALFEAAFDLGANRIQVFFKVTLPLSVNGIISGVTMVFIPALTTFAISTLLGGSKILLIGNVIESSFMQAYDWHLGSGLSIVLMIFIIINMIISGISDAKENSK